MPLRNIRPLHVLWQQSLGVGMLGGVISGIRRILLLAGVSQEIKLGYLRQRRHQNYHEPDGALTPYKSLDWHIERARINSNKPGHLNGEVLLSSLKDNPSHKAGSRYELAVVNEPIHINKNDPSTLTIGAAKLSGYALITLVHYLHLLQPVIGESDEDSKKRRFDFFLGLQMVTMHEFGHIFGLFTGTSTVNSTRQEIIESHCPNNCVMRTLRGVDLEREIMYRPFCPSCLEKLKQFFIEP